MVNSIDYKLNPPPAAEDAGATAEQLMARL